MAIMFSAHFPYYTLHPPLTPLKLDSESEIWNTPGNKFGIHPWQKPPKSNHHLVFPSWRRTSQSYQTSSLPSASACVESSPHQLCEDYRSIIKTTNITATDEKKIKFWFNMSTVLRLQISIFTNCYGSWKNYFYIINLYIFPTLQEKWTDYWLIEKGRDILPYCWVNKISVNILYMTCLLTVCNNFETLLAFSAIFLHQDTLQTA